MVANKKKAETRKEWGKNKTMINISKETKKRLDLIGHMNETSDSLINRLIDTFIELKKDRLGMKYSDFADLYGKEVLSEKQKNEG